MNCFLADSFGFFCLRVLTTAFYVATPEDRVILTPNRGVAYCSSFRLFTRLYYRPEKTSLSPNPILQFQLVHTLFRDFSEQLYKTRSYEQLHPDSQNCMISHN